VNRARLTDPPNRIVTALLAYSVLAGVLYLTGLSTPRSIDATLPPALRSVWAGCLIFGGLAALAGQYWLGRVFTAARLKRGGLRVAGLGLFAYGAAVIVTNGFDQGGQAGLTSLVFGLAFLDRAHQVGVLLRQAQPHAEALHAGRDGGRDVGG
jgi:hypothetical protein